jgi:hypothetical protein
MINDRVAEAFVRLSRFTSAIMTSSPKADTLCSFNDLRFADTVAGLTKKGEFGDESDPWPDDTALRISALTPSEEKK